MGILAPAYVRIISPYFFFLDCHRLQRGGLFFLAGKSSGCGIVIVGFGVCSAVAITGDVVDSRAIFWACESVGYMERSWGCMFCTLGKHFESCKV